MNTLSTTNKEIFNTIMNYFVHKDTKFFVIHKGVWEAKDENNLFTFYLNKDESNPALIMDISDENNKKYRLELSFIKFSIYEIINIILHNFEIWDSHKIKFDNGQK